MDKKGQWIRAMARERRSQDRDERVVQTYILKKQKNSVEAIARELGVSPNTIRGYIKEIKDNEGYYHGIYKQRLENEKNKKKELIRKLSRSNSQIFIEEGLMSFKYGLIFTLLALLWWWIPSILLFVITGVFFGSDIDITNWIYSWNGFSIFTIVISLVRSLFFIIPAYSNAKEFRKSKK